MCCEWTSGPCITRSRAWGHRNWRRLGFQEAQEVGILGDRQTNGVGNLEDPGLSQWLLLSLPCGNLSAS